MYTSHILRGCKSALSHGRFTSGQIVRQDNFLIIIISYIRSSIKNIKFTVATLKQPIKIKFRKKGTRVKNKNLSPSSTLQALYWILLGDLDGTFSFSPHTPFTELRSGTAIFLTS